MQDDQHMTPQQDPPQDPPSQEQQRRRGHVIVVAKLQRFTLPLGFYAVADHEDNTRPMTRVHHVDSGPLCFVVEGSTAIETRPLNQQEIEGFAPLAKDIREKYGVDMTIACCIHFGPCFVISEKGWELYPEMAYYASREHVDIAPERGISLDMAELIFNREMEYEAAEIDEQARRVNIHLAMALAHARTEAILASVEPKPRAN